MPDHIWPFGRRTIVRIHMPMGNQTYAYRCRGARIGDIVRVETPFSGIVYARVVGFGRKGWWGRLKHADPVSHVPDGEIIID